MFLYDKIVSSGKGKKIKIPFVDTSCRWGAYAPLFVRKTQRGFLEQFIYDAVSFVHFFMERYRLCQREANAFASNQDVQT